MEAFRTFLPLVLIAVVLVAVYWIWPESKPHIVGGVAYTAAEYHAWRQLCDEISAEHAQWRSNFPRDALVNECAFMFLLSDGQTVDIGEHMASLGYPQPRRRVPIYPGDRSS